MKIAFKILCLCFLGLTLFVNPTLAQEPENIKTESSEPDEDRPLDDIVPKRIVKEKQLLSYQPLREADVFWEKRIWRVIDVREKMNLPFAYPERPFFEILMDAAVNGDITVYSVEDDKFSYKLSTRKPTKSRLRLFGMN